MGLGPPGDATLTVATSTSFVGVAPGGDHRPRGGVDVETEHVWPVVVADRVEEPSGRTDLRELQFYDQYGLGMARRAGEDLATRADDHRVARLYPLCVVRIGPPHPLPIRKVCRDLVDVDARVHAGRTEKVCLAGAEARLRSPVHRMD